MITDLTKAEQVIQDEVSTTVTYIGYAESKIDGSEARWIIQKITAASAISPQGVITIGYASSYMNATNVWDDRLILSYSS